MNEVSFASIVRQIREAAETWDKKLMENCVVDLIAKGVDPYHVLNGMLLPVLKDACLKMDKNLISFPELVLITDTLRSGIELLIRKIKKDASQKRTPGSKIVIGTIEGDIHDLGKNLVASIFEAGGFEVVDLGRNVPISRFIKAIKQHDPRVVAVSTLVTPCLARVEELVKRIGRENVELKIIIGGWATSYEFARKLGVYWAEDPIQGLKMLKQVLGSE